jgi:hypothetical protein
LRAPKRSAKHKIAGAAECRAPLGVRLAKKSAALAERRR